MASELTLQQIESALAVYQDPYLNTDLVSAGAVKIFSRVLAKSLLISCYRILLNF